MDTMLCLSARSAGHLAVVPVFPGIQLAYLDTSQPRLALSHRFTGPQLLLHYCKSGRVCWQPQGGGDISLGPGEFSLHYLPACRRSELHILSGAYQGLLVCLDPDLLHRQPPPILADTGIFPGLLPPEGAPAFFPGDAQSDGIFPFFFHQPQPVQAAYRQLKTLELLLYLHQTAPSPAPAAQPDQMAVIRQIHEQLLNNLDKRITIEELSRQYLMNPTTMKALFKSAYGTSLAAHMKQHRMEQAAQLLVDTELSIAEIALAVGYDSPSKFSTAFKNYFQILPKEYRKGR